jgi:hypothetical protein
MMHGPFSKLLGHTMNTHLRFNPPEYDAIPRACRPLISANYPAHKLQRLLVGALSKTHPTLSDRLASFKPGQFRILHQHFWGPTRFVVPTN